MQYISLYEHGINWIVAHSGGHDKFAHMCAGLALWLLSAMLLRRPTTSVTPLVVVIIAEAANEIIDRIAHGSWRWNDTRLDIVATLFWPFLITLVNRGLLSMQPSSIVASDEPDQRVADAAPVAL
jgi:hypothetical protein